MCVHLSPPAPPRTTMALPGKRGGRQTRPNRPAAKRRRHRRAERQWSTPSTCEGLPTLRAGLAGCAAPPRLTGSGPIDAAARQRGDRFMQRRRRRCPTIRAPRRRDRSSRRRPGFTAATAGGRCPAKPGARPGRKPERPRGRTGTPRPARGRIAAGSERDDSPAPCPPASSWPAPAIATGRPGPEGPGGAGIA